MATRALSAERVLRAMFRGAEGGVDGVISAKALNTCRRFGDTSLASCFCVLAFVSDRSAGLTSAALGEEVRRGILSTGSAVAPTAELEEIHRRDGGPKDSLRELREPGEGDLIDEIGFRARAPDVNHRGYRKSKGSSGPAATVSKTAARPRLFKHGWPRENMGNDAGEASSRSWKGKRVLEGKVRAVSSFVSLFLCRRSSRKSRRIINCRRVLKGRRSAQDISLGILYPLPCILYPMSKDDSFESMRMTKIRGQRR